MILLYFIDILLSSNILQVTFVLFFIIIFYNNSVFLSYMIFVFIIINVFYLYLIFVLNLLLMSYIFLIFFLYCSSRIIIRKGTKDFKYYIKLSKYKNFQYYLSLLLLLLEIV